MRAAPNMIFFNGEESVGESSFRFLSEDAFIGNALGITEISASFINVDRRAVSASQLLTATKCMSARE